MPVLVQRYPNDPVSVGERAIDITAKGSTVTVLFNGQQTVVLRDAKFLEGPFALQFGNHGKAPGGAIKWRKVQVKPL